MEEELNTILIWAKRGTVRQFCSDLRARIEPNGYTADVSENTITIYPTPKARRRLSRPKEQSKEPVLIIMRDDDRVTFDKANEEFVTLLAGWARKR